MTTRPSTGSASDRGRRRHNADALAVHAAGGGLGVAVADGIGDSLDAARAAHLAADAAARAAATGTAVEAVLAARAALAGDLSRGDAVLIVAALRAGRGELAWVGDARAYLDDGASVRLLTHDQTMAAVVREAGGTPPPRFEHIVTQSVRTAEADAIGRADVATVIGRLALVTDGVHRGLDAAEIGAILRGSRDAAGAARLLTDAALRNGSSDNASATVVEVPFVPALSWTGTQTAPVTPVRRLSGDASVA